MSKQFPNPFDKWLPAYQDWRRKLPTRVSVTALIEFKGNFRQGGWRKGTGVTKWKPRSTKDKNKAKRALLVKTGRLKRSLRTQPDFNTARVVTDTPYAQVHNEGGTVAGNFKVRAFKRRNPKGGYSKVKAHSRNVNFKMPARPFMEMGEGLKGDINKIFETGIKEIFK